MPGLIRLVKNFDLAKDVYSTRIPSSRLKTPDGNLTFQASRFAIVGHEKTGDILVSYDGFDHTTTGQPIKRTFIDLYTPKTKELIDIYRHESLMTCVGATISEHRSLLAFTVLIRSNSDRSSGERSSGSSEGNSGLRKSRSKKDFLFHSYIAEVREKGMLYKLTIREGIVQRVQFLYVDKSRIVYLLFFLEGLFVHLYQVPTRHRQGGVEITAQPNLVSVVVKQFLWFEWDRQRSCLYVLQKSKQQNILSGSNCDLSHQNSPGSSKYQKSSESKLKHCVLQCYHFPDKTYRQTWEIPLLVHITRPPSSSSSSNTSSSNLSGSGQNPIPSSPVEPSFYHGLDHRARSSFSRYIHLVRLNGNGYCLCQQHPTVDDLASSIKVTLYLLHDKGKIEITIPMNNYDHQTIAKTRVFFGPIGSMVLIYIPSIYIHLVDCGAFHPPYPGLLLTGDHATKLPEIRNKNEDHHVHLVPNQGMGAGIGGLPTPSIGGGNYHVPAGLVIPFSSDADASEMSGHLMLDCVAGVCYEYLLDREAILNVFTSHSGQSHIQALHLAIVHMQDNELVDQILTYLCRNYPANIVTPLLREFLIGAPYLKAKQSQNVPPQLFSIMPMTSQIPYSLSYSPNRLDIVYSELKGYYVLPNASRLSIKEKEQPRIIPRFQHDILIGPDQRYIDLPIINPPNRVTNLIRSLLTFVQPEVDGNSDLDVDDENSSLTRASNQLMEAVANHIVNCYPRVVNKPQAVIMAKTFRKLIVDQTNRVYQTIIRTIEADGKRTQAMVLYQVLESLYCALEELSYPSPRGFSRSFVDYGQQCLPRSVFLQYIERDIFCLDVAFVEKIVSQLSDSTEDKLFKYELISNLKNRNQSIELMSKHHEYIDYLLQYYLSSFTLRISKEDVQQAANFEQTGESPFIPRDVFLQAIRTRFVANNRDSRGTNSFISQNEPRLHRNLIDYANTHATIESAKNLSQSI